LVGVKPFENPDGYPSQDKLRALSENCMRVAGFTHAELATARGVLKNGLEITF
jgi:hypothetical protein